MTAKKTKAAPEMPSAAAAAWKMWPKGSLWPLERIKPYALNARTHPPAQVTMLARIFGTFGPDQPIVVDEDGVILKGHGRRLAAYEARLTHFPVVQRFGLSPAEKDAMRIEDNQSALLSAWDRDLLRGGIANLKLQGYDIGLLGFGEAEFVHFTTVPAPPDQFPSFGENISVEHQCPRCKYVWSGSSAPVAEEPAAVPKPKKKHKAAAKKTKAKKKKPAKKPAAEQVAA